MAGKASAMPVLDASITYPLSELYPNMAGGYNYETAHKANPDADDVEAMNEDADVAQKADSNLPSGMMIALAVGLICLMVVFMGVS